MEKQDLDTDTDTDMDKDMDICATASTGRTHTTSFNVGQKVNVHITCSRGRSGFFLQVSRGQRSHAYLISFNKMCLGRN